MYVYGLTKDEYIGLLKECGMCTKKWTYAKIKMFNEKRLEIIKKIEKIKRKVLVNYLQNN